MKKIKDDSNTIITDQKQIVEVFSNSKDNQYNFNVNDQDIYNIMKLFPRKFTKGDNDIPLFLWNKITDYTCSHLSKIIEISLNTSNFPKSLKLSSIIPIYKKENPLDAKKLQAYFYPTKYFESI